MSSNLWTYKRTVVHSVTGAEFREIKTHPKLYEVWEDPSGMIWASGGLVVRCNSVASFIEFSNDTAMNLASVADYQRLANYMGASNGTYRPEIFQNMAYNAHTREGMCFNGVHGVVIPNESVYVGDTIGIARCVIHRSKFNDIVQRLNNRDKEAELKAKAEKQKKEREEKEKMRKENEALRKRKADEEKERIRLENQEKERVQRENIKAEGYRVKIAEAKHRGAKGLMDLFRDDVIKKGDLEFAAIIFRESDFDQSCASELFLHALYQSKRDSMQILTHRYRINPNYEEKYDCSWSWIYSNLNPYTWSERAAEKSDSFLYLIRMRGFDPNSHRNGTTIFMLACESWIEQIVKELLKFPTLAINQQDNDGNTALSRAAQNSRAACVDLLLKDSRLDPNVKNAAGLTARQCAKVEKEKSKSDRFPDKARALTEIIEALKNDSRWKGESGFSKWF